MKNKKDKVCFAKEISIDYTYPLGVPVRFTHSKKNGYFTRFEIAQIICKDYKRIYKEEEKTSSIREMPLGNNGKGYFVVNRRTTNGKYQIWGHVLSDLVLDEVYVKKNIAGMTILTLGISS